MYLDLFKKDVLIIGCGNPLLGDDGFGAAVIQALETQFNIPNNVGVFDAGTSIREILFDLLLSDARPEKLFVIDAIQYKKAMPGDIFHIDPDKIPHNKIADYSLHQFPTTNILKELKQSSSIDIQIYAVQVKIIPELVDIGLSTPVKDAVLPLCNKIYHQLNLSTPISSAGVSLPC